MLSPQERSLRARLGGLAVAARYDTRETTAAARKAFLSRFENEVDPDRVLSEGERQRRADAARKLYFARLSLKSAKARGARKGAAQRRGAAT